MADDLKPKPQVNGQGIEHYLAFNVNPVPQVQHDGDAAGRPVDPNDVRRVPDGDGAKKLGEQITLDGIAEGREGLGIDHRAAVL